MSLYIFTYGTLLSEAVLCAVLRRIPNRTAGTLHAYKRRSINGQCYPAIARASAQDKVEGQVLVGITAEELTVLAEFEDDAYDQCQVDIVTEQGNTVKAWAWVRPENNTADLCGDWDYDAFLAHDEEWYVSKCLEWRQQLNE